MSRLVVPAEPLGGLDHLTKEGIAKFKFERSAIGRVVMKYENEISKLRKQLQSLIQDFERKNIAGFELFSKKDFSIELNYAFRVHDYSNRDKKFKPRLKSPEGIPVCENVVVNPRIGEPGNIKIRKHESSARLNVSRTTFLSRGVKIEIPIDLYDHLEKPILVASELNLHGYSRNADAYGRGYKINSCIASIEWTNLVWNEKERFRSGDLKFSIQTSLTKNSNSHVVETRTYTCGNHSFETIDQNGKVKVALPKSFIPECLKGKNGFKKANPKIETNSVATDIVHSFLQKEFEKARNDLKDFIAISLDPNANPSILDEYPELIVIREISSNLTAFKYLLKSIAQLGLTNTLIHDDLVRFLSLSDHGIPSGNKIFLDISNQPSYLDQVGRLDSPETLRIRAFKKSILEKFKNGELPQKNLWIHPTLEKLRSLRKTIELNHPKQDYQSVLYDFWISLKTMLGIVR